MPGNDPPVFVPLRSNAKTRLAGRAVISRVVYCTAVIDAATNPSGYNDQDIYLRALPAASGVDHVAYGSYVARVKYAPWRSRWQADQAGRNSSTLSGR